MVAFRIALLWTIGYVFFIFHGLSFHLTPWSQAFINAVVKYTYGRTGQDETTVLLFREDNLGLLGVQYPVPYGVHAQVLEALASYGPRAVFIDFAFIDPREDKVAVELGKALCGLRNSGTGAPTPVFLAAPAGATLNEKLVECADAASPEMDETVGVSGVLTYMRKSHGLPTAAFALAAKTHPAAVSDPAARDLEVIWGKGIPRINRSWMKCEEPSLLRGLGHMLSHGPLANKLQCPYTRTITVAHLLAFSADRDVSEALSGKTVFYGAGFRLTGDVVASPVYAEMPGVYLHAMAYDNLVTFGRHYKRATRHGLGARITDAALLLVASILLVRYPRTPRRTVQTVSELRAGVRARLLGGAATVLAVVGLSAAGGFDLGLLALVVGYVLFRWWISKDLGFVLLIGITLVTAVIYYYVMDLGPRNILAFLVFFEVVRHVEKHLKELAERYFELKAREASQPQGPMWRLADAFLARYAESGTNHRQSREIAHEARESRATG